MMKLKNYIYGIALGSLSLTVASCYNADREFPDYQDGTTAYFAYQYPVRTLILGNDIYDNTLDNAHKCRIWATMGGTYTGRNATVDVAAIDTICNNLWFVDAGGNGTIHPQVLDGTRHTAKETPTGTSCSTVEGDGVELAIECTGILVVAGITDFHKLGIVNVSCQHRIQFGVAFIDCQSEVGKGTTFTIVLDLPVADKLVDKLPCLGMTPLLHLQNLHLRRFLCLSSHCGAI